MGEQEPHQFPGQAPYTYVGSFIDGPWEGQPRGIVLDHDGGQDEPPEHVLLPTGRYLRERFSAIKSSEDLTGSHLARGVQYRWESSADRRARKDVTQIREDQT